MSTCQQSGSTPCQSHLAALKSKSFSHVEQGIHIVFPFKPYSIQKEIMSKIIYALEHCQEIILKAPKASGKSLGVLIATLAWRQSKVDYINTTNDILMPEVNDDDLSWMGSDRDIFKSLLGQGKFEKAFELYNSKKAAFIATKIKKPSQSNTWQPTDFDNIPRIFIACQTYHHITKLVKQLKENTVYNPSFSVLSRKNQCLHEQESGKMNESCFKNKHIPLGTEHYLCSYLSGRDSLEKPQLIFCTHDHLVNPIIRASMEIDIKKAIVIIDDADTSEAIAKDAISLEITESVIENIQAEFRLTIKQKYLVNPNTDVLTLLEMINDWMKTSEAHSKLKNATDHRFSGNNMMEKFSDMKLTQDKWNYVFKNSFKQVIDNFKPENNNIISNKTIEIIQIMYIIFNFIFNHNSRYFTFALLKRKSTVDKEDADLTFCLWCTDPSLIFTEISKLTHSLVLVKNEEDPEILNSSVSLQNNTDIIDEKTCRMASPKPIKDSDSPEFNEKSSLKNDTLNKTKNEDIQRVKPSCSQRSTQQNDSPESTQPTNPLLNEHTIDRVSTPVTLSHGDTTPTRKKSPEYVDLTDSPELPPQNYPTMNTIPHGQQFMAPPLYAADTISYYNEQPPPLQSMTPSLQSRPPTQSRPPPLQSMPPPLQSMPPSLQNILPNYLPQQLSPQQISAMMPLYNRPILPLHYVPPAHYIGQLTPPQNYTGNYNGQIPYQPYPNTNISPPIANMLNSMQNMPVNQTMLPFNHTMTPPIQNLPPPQPMQSVLSNKGKQPEKARFGVKILPRPPKEIFQGPTIESSIPTAEPFQLNMKHYRPIATKPNNLTSPYVSPVYEQPGKDVQKTSAYINTAPVQPTHCTKEPILSNNTMSYADPSPLNIVKKEFEHYRMANSPCDKTSKASFVVYQIPRKNLHFDEKGAPHLPKFSPNHSSKPLSDVVKTEDPVKVEISSIEAAQSLYRQENILKRFQKIAPAGSNITQPQGVTSNPHYTQLTPSSEVQKPGDDINQSESFQNEKWLENQKKMAERILHEKAAEFKRRIDANRQIPMNRDSETDQLLDNLNTTRKEYERIQYYLKMGVKNTELLLNESKTKQTELPIQPKIAKTSISSPQETKAYQYKFIHSFETKKGMARTQIQGSSSNNHLSYPSIKEQTKLNDKSELTNTQKPSSSKGKEPAAQKFHAPDIGSSSGRTTNQLSSSVPKYKSELSIAGQNLTFFSRVKEEDDEESSSSSRSLKRENENVVEFVETASGLILPKRHKK